MLFILRLAQVRVQPDTQRAGQCRRFDQQVFADAEGRTGGKGNLMHGKGLRIVVLLHQTPAVLQNDIHRLDKLIRRQASVRFSQRHAASGGVKTDAQQIRCLELPVDKML